MKRTRFHKQVLKEMDSLDLRTKQTVADIIALLAAGESLGMPVSRPMPSVEAGVHELRIKDRSGQYRIFYFTKDKDALLFFHMFKKKTQQTPIREIETGLKRLREMMI